MSIFDDLPFANFGQDDNEDFPLLDVNNNYLPQPFTNEEDSNGSIFDPDNNLLPPNSEIEDMPIEMPLQVQQSQERSPVNSVLMSPVATSFQEPMFSTIDPATTFQMTRSCRKEEPFTIPNIMDEIPNSKSQDHYCKDETKPSPQRQPLGTLSTNCQVLHTPQKPADECPLDPLTPTANLKILMSAASPEIRNRDNMRRLLNDGIKVQQENRRGMKTVDEFGQDEVSRKEKSLGLLCQRFLDLFPVYPDHNAIPQISLDAVSRDLGVERRRIYDIVNVLESVEMVNRIGKNKYVWHGKSRLAHTLRALKIRSLREDYPAQIQRGKEHERQSQHQRLTSVGRASTGVSGGKADVGVFRDPEPVSQKNLQNARSGLRKDKSLSIISQKFVMIFLAADKEVLTLELAAKILSNDPDMDRNDSGKFKTKIRRLYDIANILISLDLIEKVYSPHSRGRKPGFTYIGPCLKDGCDMRGYLCGASNFLGDVAEKRGRGRRAGKGQKKKSFGRHSSFDLICRAASEERERLYSSHPSSPVKALKENVVRKAAKVQTVGQANFRPPQNLTAQPTRFINLTKHPYLKLDQLTKTELVITEIGGQSQMTNTMTSSIKRDGVTLLSDAKRTKTELDDEVTKLTESGIPVRVRTTPLHRISPRALQFDNIRSNPAGPSDLAKSLNEHSQFTKTVRIMSNGQHTPLKSRITVVVGKSRTSSQAPVTKNDQYTTPIRVLNEKAITPSTRTTLFQAMQAKLKSPEAKPMTSLLSSRGRVSFVRLAQGD